MHGYNITILLIMYYLWYSPSACRHVSGEGYSVKVGITSENLGDERIHYVAKDAGFTPEIILLEIVGTPDMRREVTSRLGSGRVECVTFDYEACAMYTQRQNELLSQYLEIHGEAPRGVIDSLLDESTLDPGKYTFEKMFSGGYLGALCLKALQQASEQGLLDNYGNNSDSQA